MALPLEPPEETSANLALANFLRAAGAAEAAQTLAHVVDAVAMPIIGRVLARKFGPGQGTPAQAEDVASEAKAQLLERLLILRSETSPVPATAPGAGTPIRDLAAYVASLAYSAWARHLSRACPGRAIVSNQLRYLLEDRCGRRGFASWQGPTGERWCGLTVWPRAGHQDHHENPVVSERMRGLISEPSTAARAALAGTTDPQWCDLEVLLKALLLWVGTPVEWHDLSTAVFQIREVNWKMETGGADEEAARRIPDPGATPHEQMRWQEYLQWLWRQAGELPPRQRTAYLLHTHAVFEWEAAGIASVPELAGQLGIAPLRCAQLWTQLPLDDLTIAEMLGCTRQQVINLRRVARDTLGRAWQRWISDEKARPSAFPRSTQVISPTFSASDKA